MAAGDSATANVHSAADRLRAFLHDAWGAIRFLLLRIRTEEWVLAGLILFCSLVCLSSGTGFDFGTPFGGYWSFFAKRLLMLFVATRILFWICDVWRPVGAVPRYLHRLLYGEESRRASVVETDLELVRGALILFAALAIYSNLKVRVPFINDARGDDTFQAMDDALFGGLAPWLEGVFSGSKPVVEFFSDVYLHGYQWMMILVFLMYVRRDAFAIRWTIMAVCFVYLIGILVTVAYPSYGPCFVDPDRFAFLRGSEVWLKQQQLAAWHDMMVNLVEHKQNVIPEAFAGIAAFPSLHIGHMIVMMVIAIRKAWVYAIWMGLMTILTFVATIGFGWHYAVDAIGGIVLAVGITYLARVLMERWDVRRAVRLGAAAPAPSR